jgi:tRNA-splicing ligase RtcB
MKKIDGHKLLNFASHLDDNTIAQAEDTASMPFVHPHIALMPHSGKGSAVGTVIPTLDAVIPAAVGVDIGCGMIAARTVYSPDPEREGAVAACGTLTVGLNLPAPRAPSRQRP